MELPGVAADQLLIDENNIRDEHWEPPVRNLDRFFTSMYQYYVAKGLPAVILQQICGMDEWHSSVPQICQRTLHFYNFITRSNLFNMTLSLHLSSFCYTQFCPVQLQF